MLKLSFIGQNTLWEKKKMLVTSIFFFSHNVFKWLFAPVRQKLSLCGKGLIPKPELSQKQAIFKENLSSRKEIIPQPGEVDSSKLRLASLQYMIDVCAKF